MIEFKQVSKRYPTGQEALTNVDLHLDAGEMAFLTGHSGAGKSTLLKLILLLERATQGQIIVAGKQLTKLPERRIPQLRRQMGIIFQDPHLLASRTVFDNVALPLVIGHHHHTQEIARRVRAALDKVGLLHKEKHYPMTLSAGERQRVGIARAIVNKPAVLLADEPTGNLDPALAEEIMHLFETFNQLGTTVLIATHDLKLVATMPYRVLRLQKGRLIGGR
jgi:cell division transport system ATP-binding protein